MYLNSKSRRKAGNMTMYKYKNCQSDNLVGGRIYHLLKMGIALSK